MHCGDISITSLYSTLTLNYFHLPVRWMLEQLTFSGLEWTCVHHKLTNNIALKKREIPIMITDYLGHSKK